MSVTFRITTDADCQLGPIAFLSARQLATFRGFLRTAGDRIGTALIEPDEIIGDSFEARVCPLALAAITAPLGHDPMVIAVVEEAQFRGRRVSVHHDVARAEIIMHVALTSDSGLELDLAYGNAYALLEALAIEAESVGDIPLEAFRGRLTDPATPARAAARRVEHYLPRLERLLASAPSVEDARLVWA